MPKVGSNLRQKTIDDFVAEAEWRRSAKGNRWRHWDGATLVVEADVTVPAQAAGIADVVREQYGRVDVLVNNAGGGIEKSTVLDSDPDLWVEDIRLNLISPYFVTRALLPVMIESGGGKIINVGSGMGHRPGTGAYTIGKAGLWMFTQSLSQEVWQHGIDVNELIPGPVATKLTSGRMEVGGAPPFAPSERVKGPDDVVSLALWIAMQGEGGPTGQSFSLARRPL